MSNSYFKFKKFTIWHDKCAMKVGTDGVLLGAWVNVDNATKILDIGTGTGVVALMLAQRSDAEIIGIEIDSDAAEQASYNANESSWKNRIKIINQDFIHYNSKELFDVIVSNPPYFKNSIKSNDDKRNLARHVSSLNYQMLVEKAASLLLPTGSFSIIVPFDVIEDLEKYACEVGLFPIRKLLIETKPGLAPKRCIVTFNYNHHECVNETILIETQRHIYTDEYINLTKDFYLNM